MVKGPVKLDVAFFQLHVGKPHLLYLTVAMRPVRSCVFFKRVFPFKPFNWLVANGANGNLNWGFDGSHIVTLS